MLEDTACHWTSGQFNRMADYVTEGVNPMLYLTTNITMQTEESLLLSHNWQSGDALEDANWLGFVRGTP